MSWQTKQHKKNQIHTLVEQAMKDPRFADAQKKQIEDATKDAFDSFLLISVDYLYRFHHCGKKALLKYIDFVVEQMQFIQKDPEYFKLLNEALADETGIDILNSKLKFCKGR